MEKVNENCITEKSSARKYSLSDAAADCGLEALRLKLFNAPLDLPHAIVDAMSDNVLTDLAEALEGLGYEVVEDIRYQGEDKEHDEYVGDYPLRCFGILTALSTPKLKAAPTPFLRPKVPKGSTSVPVP